MINPFKKRQETFSQTVYTGKVRFIYKEKILQGRVFGQPYKSSNLIFPTLYYNILSANKLYKSVPHYEIEK